MRRWINRGRQRKAKGQATQADQEQPLQPENAEAIREPEVSPADIEPAEELQPEEAEVAGSNPQPQKSRARTRRRKKKPAAQPVERTGADAIMPTYSETEGPRAPLPVKVKPGAPTGEAAELGEPTEPAEAPEPVPTAPAAPQAKRAAKGAVVLSVGLPGSGKTTWFKRKGVTPLSSDLLRTLLFDDPTEQGHQDLVFSSLRSLLRARMIARMPANYVDATNLSPKERRHWIRMAREFGYEVHAVYFEVPLETCLERNRKRQRVVPEDVMQRMAAKLRPPTFEEGFAKIVVVRVKSKAAGEAEPAAEPESTSAMPAAPEAQPEKAEPEQPEVNPEGYGI